MSAYLTYSARGGSGGGKGIASYPNLAGFPLTANDGDAAVALDTDIIYIYNLASMSWLPVASPGTVFSIGPIDSVTPSANGAVISANALILQTASISQNGLLSAASFNVFNNKQNALGFTPENAANKGQANGYASLDAGGKVPIAQLPNSIMEYQGTWSAATNTPTLANGTGNAGDVYINTAVGTVNFGAGPITFAIGDWAVYDGSIWQKSINSNSVVTVNGNTGAVVVNAINQLTGDVTTSAATQSQSLAATLATVNANVGAFGSASNTLSITVNAKGLVTAAASQPIQIAESQVTNLVSDLAGKQSTGNYLTALTGDGTASGPGSAALTLATVNANVGAFGSAANSLAITVNAKGLVTAAASQPIQIAESQVTNLVSDLAGKQATGSYLTALTGDATASGPGSAALTLATVNANVGSFGSAANSLSITVNAKGLITAASTQAIQIAESQVTNLVSDLAAKVTNPMTTGGDLIYGGASGVPTRLANGTTGYILTSGGGTSAPTWSNAAGTFTSDVFSGNGSTTGFTLSVSPGSVNNTQVYISGVYQQKANYTVVGTTLTFSTAPPTGTSNIEVISGNVLPLGTPGAGTVGRSQANLSSLFVAPFQTRYASGSGTHTLTGSPIYIMVEMVGAGGGGSGSGSAAGGTGGTGGATTFGTSLLSAGGGFGGAFGSPGSTGGVSSLGTGPTGLAVTGGGGGSSMSQSTTAYLLAGGIGGSSTFGGAGNAVFSGNPGAPGASNTGGGGSGGGVTAASGTTGSGGGSGGYVKAFISGATLSALGGSAAYAVGAGGAAGTAGTSGNTGGAGGSGVIIVTEYYQ